MRTTQKVFAEAAIALNGKKETVNTHGDRLPKVKSTPVSRVQGTASGKRKIRKLLAYAVAFVFFLAGLAPMAQAADTIAPAAPTGFRAYPGNAKAYLAWNSNTESDLAGYNVYLSATSASSGRRLNTSIIPKATPYLTHSGLINGKTYYYRIKAVDTSGNEGALSPQLLVTPAKTSTVKISGALKGAVRLKSNTIYTVTGSTNVDASALLTVEPGAVVKFNAGKNFYISGIVRAIGMPNYPIYFTSSKDDSIGGDTNGDGSASKPAAKNWSGFKMKAGSTVELERTIVRYASQGVYYYAPPEHYYDNPYFVKKISVKNCEISYCYQGIYMLGVREAVVNATTIQHSTASAMMIVHCEKSDMSSNLMQYNGTSGVNSKAVEIDPKSLANYKNNTMKDNTQNAVWVWDAAQKPVDTPNQFSYTGANATLYDDITYILYGTTWVSKGTTLTIEAGTKIKGQPGGIVVKGALVASGTTAHPITLTSYRDDSFGGNTDGKTATPSTGDWSGLKFDPGSQGSLTGVRIIYASTGISANGANVSVANSVIEKNGTGASNAAGSPTVSAERNWWGASNGPKPKGSGNAVSGAVDFDPWLSSKPF